MRLEDFLDDFLAEAWDLLDRVRASAASPDSPESIKEAKRAFHTLKGSAGMMGFEALASMCHALEDFLGGEWPSSVVEGVLGVAVAELERILRYIEEKKGEPEAPAELAAALDALRRGDPSPFLSLRAEEREEVAYIRVDPARVEAIMNSLAQLLSTHTRLMARAGQLPKEDQELVHRLDLELQELRDGVLSLRAVKVSRFFARYKLYAERQARELGKRVKVELLGGEVEVDRGVMETLLEPLLHLIRNAVDHGIEPPDERKAAGKPEEGTLRIAFSQEGRKLVVVVEDDGRGIDIERVRRAGLAQGLIGPGASQEEVLSLLFRHGFSTREKVSELSGRGVGLDVVRETLERMGGTVSVETWPGRGTRFTLEVPNTLLIAPLLHLVSGNEVYGLMTLATEGVEDVGELEVEETPGGLRVRSGEGYVPLYNAGELLGSGGQANVVVFVRAPSGRLALAFDEVLGVMDTVLRPLDGLLESAPHLSAFSVGPQGTPLFVLEPDALVRLARGEIVPKPRPAQGGRLPGEGRVALFSVGGASFAVLEEETLGFLKSPRYSRVPLAPKGLLGAFMWRGRLIPMTDPGILLSLPSAGGPWVVVVDTPAGPLGLLVDRLAALEEARILPGEAKGIRGVCELREGKALLLDLAYMAGQCGF